MSKKAPNPSPPNINMKPSIPPPPPPKRGNRYSEPFGITKRDIKAGETIVVISGGKVTSDNIDFLPLLSLRKEMTIKKAKDFKEIILKQFRDTSKTGWGKNEIVTRIKDLWAMFLEKQIEEGRR